jgi:hypothetical protein
MISKIKPTVVFAVACLFLLSFYACKKKCYDPTNRECENYDPCYGKTRINPFFRVRPGDNGFKPDGEWCNLIPCDTFNASSVRFDMPLNNPENSTYTWQVGNEPTPRIGKAFEVDFSDYLAAGNWEKHIPITLTIRTPLNGCMTHPEDTLITVSRSLFFTEKALIMMPTGVNHVIYKGYFTHEPNKEATIQYIDKTTGDFRGFKPPNFLTVGLPVVDTFFSRRCMGLEGCSNYLHSISIVSNPETCAPLGYVPLRAEWIMLDGIDRIKVIYVLKNSNDVKRFEFIGRKVK